MENHSYSIQIPEPCHEDWNSMRPDATGKFCSSCSKSVIDFSNKTDTEIRDILLHYKDQKVCGHFKSTQLDRPLILRVDLSSLPKNMSSTKTFTIAVFLAFGTFLFSGTDVKGQMIGRLEIDTAATITQLKGKIKTLPATKTGESVQVKDSVLVLPDPQVFVSGGIRFAEPKAVETAPVADSVKAPEIFMQGEIAEWADTAVAKSEECKVIRAVEKNQDNAPTIDSGAIQAGLSVYPNPSAGEFTIRYTVLKKADVRIDLLDEKGRLLKTLVNVPGQYEGRYVIPCSGQDLAGGTYLVSLTVNEERFTKRLILKK